ncbi:hypothetical protein TNCV_3471931 [Trichonephila clavipes]|nr:hypothetical protein TNCV_3471931 [Trichonephila clavipes]
MHGDVSGINAALNGEPVQRYQICSGFSTEKRGRSVKIKSKASTKSHSIVGRFEPGTFRSKSEYFIDYAKTGVFA